MLDLLNKKYLPDFFNSQFIPNFFVLILGILLTYNKYSPFLIGISIFILYVYSYFIHVDEMAFRAKPKVIISSILSSSSIRKDDIINTGDLLFYLNDIKINTLDDILNAIDTTFESFNGYAIIKNHTGDTISLNLRDSLIETIEMSKVFNYKWNNRLSKLLLKKYKINNFK